MKRPEQHRPPGANTTQSHRRLYDRRWRRTALRHLAQHPLCVRCGGAATEVDHIRPHRGDPVLFWDAANWQGLCAECHGEKSQTERGA